MVYKDFYGGLSDTNYLSDTDTIYETNEIIDDGKNVKFVKYGTQLDTFNKLHEDSGEICKGLQKFITSLFTIFRIENLNIDYKEIIITLKEFVEKINNINIEFEAVIIQLSDAVNEFKNNDIFNPSSNNISNVRNCDETFEEGISSLREELENKDPQYSEMLEQIIQLTIQSFKNDHNLKNPNNHATDQDIKKIMNTDAFKFAVMKRVLESSLSTLLEINPLVMYIPGNTTQKWSNPMPKFVNIDNKKSKKNKENCFTQTGFQNNNLTDFRGNSGLGNDNFLSFKDEINIILNNIKSGNYNINNYRNKYGGKLSEKKVDNELPNPEDVNENIDDRMTQIHDLYRILVARSNQFLSLRQVFAAHLAEFNNSVSIQASIKDLMDFALSKLLENDINYKRMVYITKYDVEYYRIMYAKILNKKGVLKQEFIAVVNYILIFLSKLKFSNDDVKVKYEPVLLDKLVKNDCSKRNLNDKYFNILRESEVVQFSLTLLDSLNYLVLSDFLSKSTSDITIFAFINDFGDNENDKIIFTKTTLSGIMYLIFIKSEECKESFTTTVVQNDAVKTLDKAKKYEIPFAYIFDNCELMLVPYYMRIKEILFEYYKCIVLFTIGYSGVGKSVLLYGKDTVEVSIKGLLQYSLQSIEVEEFGVEILEIYGRCLPLYESFNPTSNNPNAGFEKSISWYKSYTNGESFKNSGIYEHTKDTGDKFNDQTFDYDTDNKPGSLVDDPKKINEYFKKRMTNEFFEKCVYWVSKDMITAFLQNYDKNCVKGVEKKRMELGGIKPTPNNPESSRSTLIHTFIFKVKNKYITLTIIDFPGKEDPIPTYIYDSEKRDTEKFKKIISTNYGSGWSPEYIEGTLNKIIPIGDDNQFNRSDTFYNILPFNPFILLTIDYNTNIKIIDKINDFIDNYKKINNTLTKEIDTELTKMITNVLSTKFVEDRIELRKFLNENNYLIAAGLKDKESNTKLPLKFPSIKASGYAIDKPNRELQLIAEMDQNFDYSYFTTASNGSTSTELPNIIRYYYIVSIFKELLNSSLFSSNDVISILLSTIYQDIKDPNSSLSKFITGKPTDNTQNSSADELKNLDLRSKLFCNKLNNMFEAYFINETIGLLFVNLINSTKSDNKDQQLKNLMQGDKLKITDTANYLIKRLNSGAEKLVPNDRFKTEFKQIYDYNPLVNPALDKGNRIYYISSNKNDVYDDKKRENIKNETKQLYDYSKVISNIGTNSITNLLGLFDCNIYILYVVSNVLSSLKCPGITKLIGDQESVLNNIFNDK